MCGVNQGSCTWVVLVSQKHASPLSAVFPNDAPAYARYPETSLYQSLEYSSSL
jgi:hypothetical protein